MTTLLEKLNLPAQIKHAVRYTTTPNQMCPCDNGWVPMSKCSCRFRKRLAPASSAIRKRKPRLDKQLDIMRNLAARSSRRKRK
jgi:hypothetical protein